MKQVNDEPAVALATEEQYSLIPHEQILYCKASQNETEIYLADGTMFLATGSLKKIYAEDLPHHHFIMMSKTVLVNCRFVKYIDSPGKKVVMTNGTELPFSVSVRKISNKIIPEIETN